MLPSLCNKNIKQNCYYILAHSSGFIVLYNYSYVHAVDLCSLFYTLKCRKSNSYLSALKCIINNMSRNIALCYPNCLDNVAIQIQRMMCNYKVYLI